MAIVAGDAVFSGLSRAAPSPRRLQPLLVCLLASWLSAATAACTRAEPAAPGAAAATAAPSVPPASSAAVQVRNGERPGSLEILATQTTQLAPDLIVERQRGDGSFEALRNLDLASMRLVGSCGQPIKACVPVGKQGLRPVPWSGMSCSSQCNRTCDKNEQMHGRFRFVATSCDGRTRFEGPVFTLP